MRKFIALLLTSFSTACSVDKPMTVERLARECGVQDATAIRKMGQFLSGSGKVSVHFGMCLVMRGKNGRVGAIVTRKATA